PGHDPYAVLLAVAVDEFNTIVCRRVIECGPGVFRDEVEEPVPPWVPDKREEPFAERLHLLDADCANRRRNGFASGFVDFLNVNGLEWHDVVSVIGFAQQKRHRSR